MQALTGTVGDKGVNNVSDVALLQAILVKTQRPASGSTPAGPFLASYDGVYGDATLAAIRDFQTQYVFVNEATQQSVPNPNATSGIVTPNDATWTKLIEKVGTGFSDLRVLPGGKTVYVAATSTQLSSKLNAANGFTFAAEFRLKVNACINQMHQQHGIAIGVCRDGGRRDFQTQYNLFTSGRGVTNAGPGESNHNFGMAADLGFEGLRWLQANGNVTENETSWLHRLDPAQIVNPQALKFWEALRTVGTSTAVGAYRGPAADHPHLQNWDDAGVSMAARLAVLLTLSGTMHWTATRGAYSCDLGYGGLLFPVGSAAHIWNRQAAVTIDMLTRARAGAAARPGQQAARAGAHAGVPNPVPPAGANRQPQGAAPTQQDVVAMQQELRHQFELADANWQNWTSR